MYTASGGKQRSFKDYSLILPCISVGNVGQLTSDLLITTLGLVRTGYMNDDSLLPMVGNNPYAEGNEALGEHCKLCTSVEVYCSDEKKICVLQQRAPCVKGKRRQYMDKLLSWIQSCDFSQVFVLTSSFAHERRDFQLEGSQFRFLVTPNLDALHTTLAQEHSWTELERRALLPGVEEYNEERLDGSHMEDYFMPGSGMAKQFFCKCIEHNVSAVLVLSFCEEGDNAGDAIQMATFLNSYFKWIDAQVELPDMLPPHLRHGWKVPSSWRLQYGSRFSQMLYQ